MTIQEVQNRIIALKREKDICVLAHSYQAREIIEVADIVGDSFALSTAAAKTDAQNVIMCGVRFMAETVKLLSPEKTVFLANPDAGCPMADGITPERLQKAIDKYPGHTVVCYINTTAAVKTLCDVCVTSSSAVKIIRAIENDKILFIPDSNLGAYVASMIPEKKVRLINGGCPIHAGITAEDVAAARAAHPNALLLVHPECVPDVVEKADYVGSTSGIQNYAINSEHSEFIIGTEISIAEHLQYSCPEKRFYALSKRLMCHNMKLTTLPDLLNCCEGTGGAEINMDSEFRISAKKCIDKMIELG